MTPEDYDAWYRTPRGEWIGAAEYQLLLSLLRPERGATLLDVGCGSGYFARRFADAGLAVTGVDTDAAMLEYARGRDDTVKFLRGTATALPLRDGAFDYVSAVTSLCFVAEADHALREMWRVARRAVVLGMLNRHSLLYLRKHGHGGYRGARWDSRAELRDWAEALEPAPRITFGSAIFLPGGSRAARCIEHIAPGAIACGGFIALGLHKK